ncbi:MAG: hypothetical protein MJ078_05385, partial [Clostridia bacterium]|nr:hypothetical protein [Clostridia bacterium]
QHDKSKHSDGACMVPCGALKKSLPFGTVSAKEHDFLKSAYAFSRHHTEESYIVFLNNTYKVLASNANSLHMPYRYFFAGIDEETILSHPDKAAEEYRELVSGKDEASIRLYNRLGWMEHRRWNAFTRTRGFSCPDYRQIELYSFKDGAFTGDFKQMALKWHPCLVECRDNGMVLTDKHYQLDIFGRDKDAFEQLDMLDRYSVLCSALLHKYYPEETERYWKMTPEERKNTTLSDIQKKLCNDIKYWDFPSVS